MRVVWLLVDVAIGVVLAGLVAPFALAAVPEHLRGPMLLLAVAVVCIVVVALLRHVFVGTPGTGPRH